MEYTIVFDRAELELLDIILRYGGVAEHQDRPEFVSAWAKIREGVKVTSSEPQPA